MPRHVDALDSSIFSVFSIFSGIARVSPVAIADKYHPLNSHRLPTQSAFLCDTKLLRALKGLNQLLHLYFCILLRIAWHGEDTSHASNGLKDAVVLT